LHATEPGRFAPVASPDAIEQARGAIRSYGGSDNCRVQAMTALRTTAAASVANCIVLHRILCLGHLAGVPSQRIFAFSLFLRWPSIFSH
jgi:hypothetical protein